MCKSIARRDFDVRPREMRACVMQMRASNKRRRAGRRFSFHATWWLLLVFFFLLRAAPDFPGYKSSPRPPPLWRANKRERNRR